MNKLKQLSIPLVIILLISLSFRIFLIFFLPLDKLASEPLFLFELINKQFIIPIWLIIGSGLINLMLIFIIGRKILGFKVGAISALLYAMSPWAAYFEAAGSLYIFLLTCSLIFLISSRMQNSGNNLRLGMLIISSTLMIYSSLTMWFVLPLLIISMTGMKLINRDKLKVYLISLVIICLPIIFVVLGNITGFKNIFRQQVSLFSDVGLINAVNSFRGEIAQTSFNFIARFLENRYIYLSQHLLFNVLKHLSLVTYFTSEFKILNFSFSPPILLGFLLPLLTALKYFLVKQTNNQYNRWILLISFALILPSVLSKNSPDINRLILFSPIIFLWIGIGFVQLVTGKKLIYKFILCLTLILIFIQGLTTVSDIYLREPVRFQQSQKGR